MKPMKRASYLTAALVLATTTGVTAPSQAVGTPTPAGIDCGAHPYNHRKMWGRDINLWKCYGIPGSHGPMWHAQVAHANHNDFVILRYRTTQDQRWIEYNSPMSGQDWANTGNYYAHDDEVQACAKLWAWPEPGWTFFCAWTANDIG